MRICRETSLDIRFADHPLIWERGNCAFPCFRRGRVRAEPGRRVKGRVPCGFLGQRPKPSESLPDPIFASFQGSDRPFFRPWFFIDYLTLPEIIIPFRITILNTFCIFCVFLCPALSLMNIRGSQVIPPILPTHLAPVLTSPRPLSPSPSASQSLRSTPVSQ